MRVENGCIEVPCTCEERGVRQDGLVVVVVVVVVVPPRGGTMCESPSQIHLFNETWCPGRGILRRS